MPLRGWAGAGFAKEPHVPIADLVAQVSLDRLRATVLGLSGFPTRWTDHPGFPAVTDWVADAMASTGTGSVTRQAFAMPSGKTRANVLGGDPVEPRGIILLGAHYDSISERPAVLAPGANDNATGIAAMLEARRILSDVALNKAVVCAAFAGEEQGLIGSTACSVIARQQGWPIDLMINLDMLGFRPPDPAGPIIIEYDQGNAVPGNDAAAAEYGAMAARMAVAHTTLATTHTDIWGSDYMPFEAQGFACIGIYDGGADGPRYHSSSDIAAAVDFDRLAQVTRLLIATVVTAAG